MIWPMNDYERVARVIQYLGDNFKDQPSLERLAGVAGLSVFHFHRLFRRWVGTTPKNFLQHLTAVEAGRLLRAGSTVLDASLDVGLSGPGRLHDLCVNLEAASPGEIRSGGEGWTIRAGFCGTPFGDALIAEGPRGICKLAFVGGEVGRSAEWAALRRLWPHARLARDDAWAEGREGGIFSSRQRKPLNVLVKGTEFQVKVWRALVEIPPGEVKAYGDIAHAVGTPQGSRAVGTAVGSNPVAYIIPCHRVIAATGRIGGYRWEPGRKKALLAWEQARAGTA